MPPTFPRLRTNAIAQYPATQRVAFRNQVVRFIDGTDQRYRDSNRARRRWEIRLDQLDEGEITAVEQFFLSQQGRFATFTFSDPWDEQVYSSCSFENDELSVISLAELKGQTSFIVVENLG